ncbi:MATE family efflux transporter [[Clostridium] dakarense]|uniref:MATE family efflux transporter n=1 Tax=Faecalimicrobium dakarense TaxID=1301100 RepID=UPI0004ADC88B|nr:MATE family efflux transporter [[Clostridium] dakarense]
MDNQESLRHESISKLLIKYSVPAILAMMVTSLYNTVDRAFIGSIDGVGALAISGLGITMPIFTIIVGFGVLISVGGSTNISIKLGEQDKENAEKVLGNTLMLAIIISLIVMIIGILFIDKILYLFGASEHTISYARDYIGVIFLGTPFNLIAFSLNNAIRAEGNPKLAAKTMIVGCILNVILDPIFIFVFDLGIKGAAIATVLCQIIISMWVLSYFLRRKSSLELKKSNLKLDFKIVKVIIAVGLAPFLMEMANGLIHVISNTSLKVYGGDFAIGAMTCVTSIYLLFMMPVFGLSQGMQTIIAYNYGAKQYDRSKKALILAIITAIFILTTGFILIKIFPEFFIGIFNKDEALIDLAKKGININLFAMPIVSIAIIGPVYFQSIGKVKQSMFLTLLRQFIILVPLILTLPRILGLDGVWISQPIADIMAVIIVSIFLIKEFKSQAK